MTTKLRTPGTDLIELNGKYNIKNFSGNSLDGDLFD